MSYYYGLDPGTDCGYAVLAADGSRVCSGTWELKPGKWEGGGMRYLKLHMELLKLLKRYPPAALAYEAVAAHKGTYAAHIYGGIVAMITSIAEEREIPYDGIPVGTAKKHATGSGAASKDAMREAAAERWGFQPGTDDEADALWIADCLRVTLDKLREAC